MDNFVARMLWSWCILTSSCDVGDRRLGEWLGFWMVEQGNAKQGRARQGRVGGGGFAR